MSDSFPFRVSPGEPFPGPPFGVVFSENGATFRIFSRNAERVWLLFFDNRDAVEPAYEIEFDPDRNRSGDIWHMFIEGLKPGALYLYRMDGPRDIVTGHRFNSAQWLLDPYAKAIATAHQWGGRSYKKEFAGLVSRPGFYEKLLFAGCPKCVAYHDIFDWGDDSHPRYRPAETIIYEAHVRGLTQHPDSGFRYKGTFRGVTEIIPHLLDLGVTTLELLPVQQFNELESDKINPVTGDPLLNYWGYSTYGFFSPNAGYGGSDTPGGQVAEFKEMVKALHKAGIEVILDVVFNHTAEGNDKGPVYSFKGIDNSVYYLLDKEDRSVYLNYTGCGNTVNCNHPVVRRFIVNCLRYWVVTMRVDGFRFDLASVLGRDREGNLMQNSPLIESIAEDPVLRNAKLIAEAWDAAGAYQVGAFPGRWAEWNGKFRDDVRAFLKGEPMSRPAFAYRLTGSSDLYADGGRSPVNSINFVTSHDGFTLNDLVTYNEKRNIENGEDNRDGENHNISDNCGVEGETGDSTVNSIRSRQVRNFLTVLLLSQGVPMLPAGDEFRRTQRGNNNAYCHDDEISWIDWALKEKNSGLYAFCRALIVFRKNHPVFRRRSFFKGQSAGLDNIADITWFDPDGKAPDWTADRHLLACLIHGRSSEADSNYPDDDFFMMFNMSRDGVKFRIPRPPTQRQWHVVINTARSHPNDIYEPGREASIHKDRTFRLVSRSIVVLQSKN